MTWHHEHERQRLVNEWRQNVMITLFVAVATFLSSAIGIGIWFCVKWAYPLRVSPFFFSRT